MQELPSLLMETERQTLEQTSSLLTEKGVPTVLALWVTGLGMLFSALDIVESAHASNLPVEIVAEMYFALGVRLHLHWLRDQVLALPLGNRWHSLARAALRDDLYSLHSLLATEVLQIGSPEQEVSERIEAWTAQNGPLLERWLQVLNDIKSGATDNRTTLS